MKKVKVLAYLFIYITHTIITQIYYVQGNDVIIRIKVLLLDIIIISIRFLQYNCAVSVLLTEIDM